MAYNELIKNFNRIREYMREFYVYGFKSRNEYTKKSARSYDDERRRMESLLGDHMKFRRMPDGKNVFLSIDSRVSGHNPLYKAWKAKSFTDGDVTLHFLLLDVLAQAPDGMELTPLADAVFDRLPENARLFDDSTIRKKMKEYVGMGIVRAEKTGKKVTYYPCDVTDVSPFSDVLDFFSEVAPCGVVGSFLLDKTAPCSSAFLYKHHYITGALDSEIFCSLLEAMGERKNVVLTSGSRRSDQVMESNVVPLRILQSVADGRQYLMAYVPRVRRITSFRLDRILKVTPNEPEAHFDRYRSQLDEMQKHMWGVSTQSKEGERLEHVDFTVTFTKDEMHIPKRLEREKRCGTVEYLTPCSCRFSADVYDAAELVPWIRSFICRITEIRFSNETLQKRFIRDLQAMYAAYGLQEGGDA